VLDDDDTIARWSRLRFIGPMMTPQQMIDECTARTKVLTDWDREFLTRCANRLARGVALSETYLRMLTHVHAYAVAQAAKEGLK
jgi:hypothetical protein